MVRRFVAFLLVTLVVALPARASDAFDELSDAMELTAILEVMREEGIAYGEELAADMFAGAASADWQADVAEIYAADRLNEMFLTKLEDELADADLAPMADFFVSDLGRRVVTLEVSARRAMLDEAVEEAADLTLEDKMAEADPRLDLLREFVETGDLVEANVVGGMNSNYAFYRGLIAGGAFPYDMSEDQILSDVWGQEREIREETRQWLMSYLLLAYDPLSDEDLEAYTQFFETEPGKDLNRALFAAFDVMFTDVSYQLGLLAAKNMVSQEL